MYVALEILTVMLAAVALSLALEAVMMNGGRRAEDANLVGLSDPSAAHHWRLGVVRLLTSCRPIVGGGEA
jgi:hypothetical protein